MEERICVIGGSNIDICGASIEPLRNFDSNPGIVTVRYGGVGRNIAQILALLETRTQLVSVFSSESLLFSLYNMNGVIQELLKKRL